MSFGQRLRELRRDFDLSQADLADRAGCSVDMLRKLESDQRRPSRELAARLAEVFELSALERADFVRLARGMATSPIATGLPAPPTKLIGREQDLRDLRALLASGDVRLVTLLGPPGVGKTRLALQLASDVQAEYRDGVVFVALAPIHDPALVVEAIAEAVGARGGAARPLADALLEHVRGRHLLVVLDNFEQVVEARSTVAAMLSVAPRLRVLVTSRQALSIYGEYCFEVPPLRVAADAGRRGPLASPAEALFLERARAIRPGYARDPRDQALVAELCRRLNGLPLAIELAASRARTTPPAALLEQVGQSLDVLSSGPADFTDRQRSMRGALDWSYRLLTDVERLVFAQLSVFAGGCSVESAAAVTLVVDVGAVVESLADKSLLQVGYVSDQARFSMLEIVREYASEHLIGDVAVLHRRHAEYFAALAIRAAPELIGPRQVAWLRRLDAEHDNFRAALDWSLSHDAIELAGQVCAGLWRFWRDRGFLHEGRRWLGAVLDRAEALSAAVRADVLNGAGALALLQSDYGVATELLVASRDAFHELGDTAGVAQALSNLGIVAHDTGDMDRAQALFDDSLELRRTVEDAWGEASAQLNLGMIDLDRGFPAAAQERFADSARLFRRVGDMRGLAQALSNLGWATLELHDYARATAYLSESLELAEQLAAARLRANNLSSLALIAWYTNEYGRAADLFLESLAAFHALGDRRGVAESLEGLAGLAGAQTRPRDAARLLGCAAALRESFNAPLLASDAARYATAVETARDQLDDSTWEHEWAEGRRSPPEELVSELLDGGLRRTVA